jgi:hypothetical protein
MEHDRTNLNVRIALAASVVFHLMVCLLALPAMLRAAAAMAIAPLPEGDRESEVAPGEDADGQSPKLIELEVQMPEFVEFIERPEVKLSLMNYLRTTQNESNEAPDQAAFQSDRNTQAASEQAPAPDATAPLPTQQGPDLPVVELATREYADGEIAEDRTLGAPVPESDPAPAASAAEAQASAQTPPSLLAPTEQPRGEETPKPGEADTIAEETAPRIPEETFAEDPDSDLLLEQVRKPLVVFDEPKETEEDDSLSELKRPVQGIAETPPERYDPLVEHRPPSHTRPALRPGTDKVQPDMFQPQTRKNELRGTISNRGNAAADAVETPLGRYMRKVTSAIEKEWNRKRVKNSDFVTYGNIRLHFFVNRKGQVEDLRILNRGNANVIMGDFTISAVLEAPIPPIPAGLVPMLEKEKLPVTYDIIIY